MTLFQILKANSRRALRGHWPRAILAPAIVCVCWGLLAMIRQYALTLIVAGGAYSWPGMAMQDVLFSRVSLTETVILAVFLCLVILLGIPLFMGVMNWYYQLTKGKAKPFAELFTFFESFRRYHKAIWLFITVFVRSLFWAFAFMVLPSSMLFLSLNLVNLRFGSLFGNLRTSSAIGAMGLTVSVILLVLSVALYAIFMNRYTLSFYLFFEQPEEKITALVRKSIRYSKGYRASMLGFNLSFIGWFLLCVLVIPAFYVIPYYMAASTMYCYYIIERRVREATEQTREFDLEEQLLTGEKPEPGDIDAREGAFSPETPELPFSSAEDRSPAEPVEEDLDTPLSGPLTADVSAPPSFNGFPQNTVYAAPPPVREEMPCLDDTAPLDAVNVEED